MQEPIVNDIVRLIAANCEAAQFCIEHSITGVVRCIHHNDELSTIYEIDVGFNYNLFVTPGNLALIVSSTKIPLPEES